MNAYSIVTTEDVTYQEVIDPELGGPWYREPIGDLVFARSRGHARAVFCRHYGLEFTWPLTIEVVAKNIDRDAGIARGNDILWFEVDPCVPGDEHCYLDYPTAETDAA